MESVGSSNSHPSPHSSPRISRALHHPLLLLRRSGHTFHILGSTSNVYTITLSQTPACSCPDPATPCKHILFILLRVLRLPLSHPSLLRRSLPRSLLSHLLSSPTHPDSLANPRLLRRFSRRLFLSGTAARSRDGEENRSRGGACPVCLEEMEERVVRCGVCGNGLHEECWGRWKRVRGRRGARCVICRARWRERREADRYLNLADVVGGDEEEEEEEVEEGGGVDGGDRGSVCGEGAPG